MAIVVMVYTHVSKCKNNEIIFKIKILSNGTSFEE
jgi:hypothetical protein